MHIMLLEIVIEYILDSEAIQPAGVLHRESVLAEDRRQLMQYVVFST